MSAASFPPVFDGHNDSVLRLFMRGGGNPAADFLAGFPADGKAGHLDLPRMRAGGFAGGLFAVFVPSSGPRESSGSKAQDALYDVGLPPPLGQADALPPVLAMTALLLRIEAASKGRFRICRSAADIRAAMADRAIAAVLHFEGAESIDPDFHALDVFHQVGLRSIGPVWSRPTLYANGVPFRFPASPDIGDGLTDHGKALVRACNTRRIAVDLSHINEKGFRDVAKLSDAPLIASHSNAHAVCAHARNLTDDQLRAVRDSGGIAGLNFATCFLRPDGRQSADTGLDVMLRHLDHMIEIMGVDHVGLGSDFDGALIPGEIKDSAGLPALQEAMRAHGYDDATLAKLSHENWLRTLEATWGE